MQELTNRISQALAAFFELAPADDLTADRGFYIYSTLERLYENDPAASALLSAINDEPSFAKLSELLALVSEVVKTRPEMVDQFEADLESGPMT